MANVDLSNRRRKTGAGAEKLALYSDEAMTGKSSFGSVAKEKFERPASTVRRPEALSSETDTNAPSGSLRTISCNVTAETVVAPARSTCATARSTTSISRSVARNCTVSPSASIKTFARIGMVLRRSTTDCACDTALSSVPRSMLNFMRSSPDWPDVDSNPHQGCSPSPCFPISWLDSSRGQGQESSKTRNSPFCCLRVSGFQRPTKQIDVVRDLGILLPQLFDPAHTMHHRGVIPSAKMTTDLGQGACGQLLAQIHRDLPRPGKGAHPLGSDKIRMTDQVMIRDLALNFLD